MNMSEDVTAVSMQVSEKAADAALAAFKSVLDSVGRLFRELLCRKDTIAPKSPAAN